MKRVYCPKCDKLVDFTVKKTAESFKIRGKKNIHTVSDVVHCDECDEKLFHEIYDQENIRRVYIEYNKQVPEDERIELDGEE